MGVLRNRGMLFLVLIVAAAGPASAATYVVGDNLGGWRVPNGGAADYANWASRHVFRVGDVLVFNFTTGAHDVAVTTKAAFESCSSSNPSLLITVGPANITVNSSGEHHYICTFGPHCSLGQKLAINASTSAAPAPAPTPTPTPSPSPSPSPSPATPTPAPAPTPTPRNSPSPSPASAPSPSGGGGATSPSSPGSGSPTGSTPSDAGVSSPPPPPGGNAASSIATTGVSLAATCVAIFYGIVMM